MLLVSEKEFINTLKEGEGVGFSLIVKPKEAKQEKKVPIPHEVQQVLNQFKEIISDGALATLPHVRAINLQIDFKSWSIITQKRRL